jgi:hypothetical protein
MEVYQTIRNSPFGTVRVIHVSDRTDLELAHCHSLVGSLVGTSMSYASLYVPSQPISIYYFENHEGINYITFRSTLVSGSAGNRFVLWWDHRGAHFCWTFPQSYLPSNIDTWQ